VDKKSRSRTRREKFDKSTGCCLETTPCLEFDRAFGGQSILIRHIFGKVASNFFQANYMKFFYKFYDLDSFSSSYYFNRAKNYISKHILYFLRDE
jgi:hypothetical protein